MKQYITTKQLKELTNKARQDLRDWWKPKEGDYGWFDGETKLLQANDTPFVLDTGVKYYPLLSIGQMIEILDIKPGDMIPVNSVKDSNEPCDALWEAVKKTLK